MQWFLYGPRWLLFYIILFLIIGGTSLISSYFNCYFFYREIYLILFFFVLFINFLPTLLFSMAGLKERDKQITSKENRKINFLVIIPAYNEKEVILNSVGSLLRQKQGSGYCARVIVAFNGIDETGDIAREYGAEVITTPEPKCGKSKAIDYVLSQVTAMDSRYVVIIDADNVVAPDFLEQTAKYCQLNRKAYQCNHQPLLASNNWISLGLQAAYCSSSRLYNTGRSKLLNSALLCGTGMVIREDVIRFLWSKVKTQTEDIELNGLLSLYFNSGVEWIPEAVFYDEKPDQIDIAVRQRVRWMVGHSKCFYFYVKPLIKQAIKQRNIRAFELGLYYLVPLSLFFCFLWLALLIPVLLVGYNYPDSFQYPLFFKMSCFFVAYMFSLPFLGYFLQNKDINPVKRFFKAMLYSFYSMLFATFTWPISILFAVISLSSDNWIFHTPHKVKVVNYES